MTTTATTTQTQPQGTDQPSAGHLDWNGPVLDTPIEIDQAGPPREISREHLLKLFPRNTILKDRGGLVIKGTLASGEHVALRADGETLTLMVDADAGVPKVVRFLIPKSVDIGKVRAYCYAGELTILIPKRRAQKTPRNSAIRNEASNLYIDRSPIPIRLEDTQHLLRALAEPSISRHIPHSEQTGDGLKMLEDDRIITKEGSRYFPIPLAAGVAQVPRTTLLNWINAKVEFQGRPLQTYNSPTTHKSYLKEESVERVARRFIKWPSKEPVGSVVIGETDDQTGYIGIAKAARALGVDHHTIWLWTTHGTTPTEKSLDVIKCSASDQIYIREKDVSELKKLIPRSGLRRGRRPRSAIQPQ